MSHGDSLRIMGIAVGAVVTAVLFHFDSCISHDDIY